MHYIIINGKAGVGKDTFVKLFKDYIGIPFVKEVDSVEVVKKAAKLFGWKGDKTPRNRKFLADLKALTDEWDNCSIKHIINSCESFKRELEAFELDSRGWIFIHCREPKNIALLAEKLNAITLYIDRDVENYSPSNDADAFTESYQYDYHISNNGTIEELNQKVKDFYRCINDNQERGLL